MLFNLALFSSLLVAPVVLALPPDLDIGIARRGMVPASTFSQHGASGSKPQGSPGNWAGAILSKGDETFNYVGATITIPKILGHDGAGVSAWVGLDGRTCQTTVLQAGVIMTIENGKSLYGAWYEWYPNSAALFPDINFAAGDVVKLTVASQTATTGIVLIENQSTGQVAFQNLNSSTPLCGRDAEWIVEDYDDLQSPTPVALADFGTMVFMDAKVGNPKGAKFDPAGAALYDMELDPSHKVLIDVSADATSITFKYE